MTSVTSLSSASISSAITTDQKRLQKPITQLQTQATGEQAEISAWGTIQGSVSSLSGALANIADIGTLNTRAASSTQSSVATATAAASAAPNAYSLTNIKLAKPQEIYSALQTSPTQSLGSGAGSLQFTLASGKTETVQIPAGSNTLNGIAAAINAAAGGVQASVIGTSSGARLVLQSAAPGSANGFTFTGGGGLAALHYASAASGGSFTRAQPAQSASFDINGVPVTSASNSISSAVSGVTLNLLASGAATITVASSAAAISSNLASVASTLSAATAAIAKATRYVPASSAGSASSAKSGPLLGNYTATALANSLLTAVSGAAASGLSANAIGFSVSTSGSVSFNAGSFATAYAANPTAVTALVNKLYAGLNSLTTAALGSATSSNSTAKNSGEIGAQTAALQNQITALTAQENQIAKDNSAALEILVQQYTSAESASTNAQITQAYLSIFTGNSSSGV
jgi:flagellar hook-associated protein 2